MKKSRYSRQTKPLNNKKGMFNLKRKRTWKGILQVPNIKKHFKLGTGISEVFKRKKKTKTLEALIYTLGT